MKDFQKNANLALIVIDIQKSDFADLDNEDKAISKRKVLKKDLIL